MSSAAENEPVTVWDQKHLRLAIDAAGVAMWSWNVDTDSFSMDKHGYELWELPVRPFVDFETLSGKIHPADRDRVRAAFKATRAIVGAYEIDFRVDVGDEVRWVSARGQGDDADIEARRMYGIFLDVTARKQSEEAHELLAGEMSHRVKNLLTVATALTQVSSRATESTAAMARELSSRLGALGRAHDLVRPGPGGQPQAALLGDLIAILLAPYDEEAAPNGRIRIAVPRLTVGESAATTLALVLHELATNSVKYGALSCPTGTLDVSCVAEGDDLIIVWTEHGGPRVEAPATPEGFGSKLLARSLQSHFKGSIEREWPEEGAIITLRLARDRLEA